MNEKPIAPITPKIKIMTDVLIRTPHIGY